MANGNVVLLYVKGITRQDTPYFPNLAAQEAFFGNINLSTRIEVGDGYYPPHYNDVLSVETSDFEPLYGSNAYNYLYLVFRTKRYYYFIDDIEYVNENLVRLHITMDIIQTHMFDAHVRSGVIERKFIKRDHLSGRTYIRENLSMGNMRLKYRTKHTISTYTYNNIISCFLIKFSGDTAQAFASAELTVNGETYTLPFKYIIIPLEPDSLETGVTHIYDDGLGSVVEFDIYRALNHYGERADCLEILYLPYCNIDMYSGGTYHARDKYIEYDNANHCFEIVNAEEPDSGYLSGPGQWGAFSFTRGSGLTEYNVIKFNKLSATMTFNSYDSSRSVETKFLKTHVPALVDENYMNIEFGTVKVASPCVLHLFDNYTANFDVIATPDGARVYYSYVNADTDYTNITRYPMADTTPLKYTTVNDPWQTFIAYNAGTLLTHGVTCVADMISSASMFASASRAAELSKQMLALDANRLTAQYKIGLMRKTSKVNKQLSSINYGYDMAENALQQQGIEQPSAIKAIGGGMQGALELAGQCLNAVIAPQSVKENINFITQELIGNCALYYTGYEVEDINNVAEYYHRNGYLVLEPYNPLPNPETGGAQDELIDLINYINTRYYYNILKMSEVSCFTTNDNTLDTQALLEDRLIKGVRFWNPIQGMIIGNFFFDNVEKEYVNE